MRTTANSPQPALKNTSRLRNVPRVLGPTQMALITHPATLRPLPSGFACLCFAVRPPLPHPHGEPQPGPGSAMAAMRLLGGGQQLEGSMGAQE